jgi:hypothetical protein
MYAAMDRDFVEYKNTIDWSNDENKEKRDLGERWAARSGKTSLHNPVRIVGV